MIGVRLVSSSVVIRLTSTASPDARVAGRARTCRRQSFGKQLHHANLDADHAERRRAVADGSIDPAALVEMHQEIAAVAAVADDFEIVAVGDIA
jgi:hypothetical protein